MTSMFSSLLSVDALEKFADPVTTIGSSPSGSINKYFVWMNRTCAFRFSVTSRTHWPHPPRGTIAPTETWLSGSALRTVNATPSSLSSSRYFSARRSRVNTASIWSLSPNAAVRNTADLARPASFAYQSRAASDPRGVNTVAVPSFKRRGGTSHDASLSALIGFGVGLDRIRSHASRYDLATFGSRTTCPTFDCPKMPPSVTFVDPVHTDTGVPSRQATTNLLCAMLTCWRGETRVPMPASAMAFSLLLLGSAVGAPTASTTSCTSAPASDATWNASRTGA